MVGWRRLVSTGSPEHSVPLRIWTLAAVIVSVFAVTASDEFLQYRLTIPVLVAAGFAFSYRRRGGRNWWVKVILAALCLQVGWLFLRDVLADPFQTSVPLTVLLLWLQTLHSFDVPARRDLLFSLLSSVILMAVAAAFALDLTYLLYLALYALAAVQALVHNAWQAAQEAAGERPPMPQGASEHAALESVRRGFVLAANHLLVFVLLGAGAVFMLTPRFEGMRLTALPFSPQRMLLDLFTGRIINPAYPEDGGAAGEGQPSWNSRGYFGFSPTVDLRRRGRLDNTVVMRVRSTHEFNWRALIFDTYTGTGWRISDSRLTQLDGSSPPITIVHRRDEVLSYGVRTIRVIQSFYIDVEQPNVVFAVPLAERLFLPTGRVYLDRYGSMRLPGTLKPGMVYSVMSSAMIPDPVRLRAAKGEMPRFVVERYLALPPLPDRVAALAQRLVAGQPTLYDRVTAVNRYLRANYRYDLTIPFQRRPGDAVDYFLFEERRGYCEQFSSAMAVLLRSVGIPARLATGYGPGSLNPVTGLFEVRNSDAHAWVEVFFPGVGWVDFEPTPGFPETADLGQPALRRWVWQDVAGWLQPRLQALAARFPLVRLILAAALPAAKAGLWIAVTLAGVLAATRTWDAIGQRGAARGQQPPLAEIYRQMCAALAHRGLRRRADETVAEFRRRVETQRPLPEVSTISAIVEAAAYGAASDHDAVGAASRALNALRARLRDRSGPPH